MTDHPGAGLTELITDYVRRSPQPSQASKVDLITGHVRAMIDDGIFRRGDPLPSTASLAAYYKAAGVSVSIQWCQEAYRRLRSAGLVQTDPGNTRAGTWVADVPAVRIPRGPMEVLRDEWGYYFDELSRLMRMVEHYGIARCRAPNEIADLLGGVERVVARTRVTGRRERREQIATTWLPLWLVERLPILEADETGPGGVEDRIEEVFGQSKWVGYHWAIVAHGDDTARLAVPDGTPLLVQAAVGLTGDEERPVCVLTRVWDGRVFKSGPTPMVRAVSAAWPVDPATRRP